MSFKIPGRVIRRLISEGERVINSQTVALFDKTELEQELVMRRCLC